MATCPESGCPLSVRGGGLAEAKLGNKRKRSSTSNGSNATTVDEDEHPTSDSSQDDIWRMLPEDLLDLLPPRLSFAAQRRLRCVCKKWKDFESVPPPYVTLSTGDDRTARFYCDSERKWFSLPSNSPPLFPFGKFPLSDVAFPDGQQPTGMKWEEVVDVDAGLVCYQLGVGRSFWYWVCNPLDSCKSQLILPRLFRRDLPKPPKVKLIVDRAKKTYKLYAVVHTRPWEPLTMVYESESIAEGWDSHLDKPQFRPFTLFGWKHVLYAYNSNSADVHQGSMQVAVFNTESGQWTEFEAEIPDSESGFPTHRSFVSDDSQLLLILFSHRKQPRPFLSVWKLLGSSTTPNYPFLKWREWQKVTVPLEEAVIDLSTHRLESASCGPENVSFRFSETKITGNLFRTDKLVRYSFAAKNWSLTSCPGTRGSCGYSTLYNWEPSLQIDPSFKTIPLTRGR